MNGLHFCEQFDLSEEDELEIHSLSDEFNKETSSKINKTGNQLFDRKPKATVKRETAGNVEQFCPKLDIDYLFKSRYHQLKGFIRKRVSSEQDAEDLAQTTYLEALNKSGNFKGLSRPDVWLFGIALNMVRNHRKKESNRTRVWEEVVLPEFEQQEASENPEDIVDNNRFLTSLHNALAALPEDMKEVFQAVILDNQSYQQTAELMGVPTGTVRSRLSRAREKLKVLIA
jgi:RNA polymerase sigma factor (sigma-70 family)